MLRRGIGGPGRGMARRSVMRRHRRMRRRMRRRLVVGGAVLLAVGVSAVKMTPDEVQQVEQHTGMKAEDLSEEQLDAAMEELGIEGQEPTDQEIAMLEAEEDKAAGQPAAASAQAQPAPASQDEVIAQLERLGALKAQGLLTEEEFAAQKAKLLRS
ncbi:MAG TPA: SHOCT domain-containing protein [Anaerolineae bacterium]|nr:SHOCT domain-containing protein [Anaerolineae bacterium]